MTVSGIELQPPRKSAWTAAQGIGSSRARGPVFIDHDLVARVKVAADDLNDLAVVEAAHNIDLAQFPALGHPYVSVAIGRRLLRMRVRVLMLAVGRKTQRLQRYL